MAERPLNPDEAALWDRVVASVRPIVARAAVKAVVPPRPTAPKPVAVRPAASIPATKAPRPVMTATLDGTWDRQLAHGVVVPDATIDLHGDTLDRAYARIDGALDGAIRRGARVLLLVTGKPRPDRAGGRGAIRAVVGDWLAASRHATGIAAVRPAHPRHGGAGALYVILRRR